MGQVRGPFPVDGDEQVELVHGVYDLSITEVRVTHDNL